MRSATGLPQKHRPRKRRILKTLPVCRATKGSRVLTPVEGVLVGIKSAVPHLQAGPIENSRWRGDAPVTDQLDPPRLHAAVLRRADQIVREERPSGRVGITI